MATVTALEVRPARHKLVRVYLDGRYALSLEPDIAAGLTVEQQLTAAEIERLKQRNEKQRALASAFRSLANRPCSSLEIRQKLERKKFDEETIDAAVSELAGSGLLDDAGFARHWCEDREAFRPRSRRVLVLELRRKGVDAETAAEAVSSVDDRAGALKAASRKARNMDGVSYEVFSRRLGDYLKRRGYNYETIQKTVRELWENQQS
jgi:regulatory protein